MTRLLILMTLAAPAFAGGKKPSPPPADPPVSVEQAQQQGQGQLQGQQQRQVTHSQATSAASGHSSSGGNSTSFGSNTRALALSLPGHSMAAAVQGCHESNGSRGAFGIGTGGKTRINDECIGFLQCVALADRYAAWGQVALAVEQLATCGGVEGAVIHQGQGSDEARYLTRDEAERMFEAVVQK